MLKNRTFNVVYVNQANPKAFDLKVKGKTVKYSGTKQVIKL